MNELDADRKFYVGEVTLLKTKKAAGIAGGRDPNRWREERLRI
jgi:hypothetical protein